MTSAPDAAAPLRTRNDAVLTEMAPFVVALPQHAAMLDTRPFGLEIAAGHVFDPTRMSSERFLRRLQTLDRLTFGPAGMPMPRWVFYNCAELPGAIFGFGRPAESLPASVREALELSPDEAGLVPFSMYIAIPVEPPHTWVGHNLASLNPVFPNLGMKGLASITKALGLKVFRCRTQLGATQWSSQALHIHVRFGPLALRTAWTPAHSEPNTLTYLVHLDDEALRHACGDPSATLAYPAPTLEIAADDHGAMQELQRRVEAGERFAVVGPPRRHGQIARVPIARLPGP
ncbi:hypothetical protein [Haliangium sp.]|uniref:hypothetical protein n=1 Tax=Haliangium sp. TaxID=2663208 RepID=UPI003D09D1B0